MKLLGVYSVLPISTITNYHLKRDFNQKRKVYSITSFWSYSYRTKYYARDRGLVKDWCQPSDKRNYRNTPRVLHTQIEGKIKGDYGVSFIRLEINVDTVYYVHLYPMVFNFELYWFRRPVTVWIDNLEKWLRNLYNVRDENIL